MAIFNCYVSSPEGKSWSFMTFQGPALPTMALPPADTMSSAQLGRAAMAMVRQTGEARLESPTWGPAGVGKILKNWGIYEKNWGICGNKFGNLW